MQQNIMIGDQEKIILEKIRMLSPDKVAEVVEKKSFCVFQ